MILATGAFSDGSMSNTYAVRSVLGADVRFQFTFPVDQREPARAAAADIKRDMLSRGARSVTFDEIVQTQTRSISSGVAQARGYLEKLEAHWADTNFDPGDRRLALRAKATRLHEATSEA
jgi:hypothetical protein